ncbi:hypothetical protein NC651_040550 [Populus alba x Populus x berolinensis]|nr:hypothetical protein NC651_040550 [Populus alba x Populus x berolinensis]
MISNMFGVKLNCSAALANGVFHQGGSCNLPWDI